MNIRLVNAIVRAAEREGGFDKLLMIPGFTAWKQHIKAGYLWYNVIIKCGKKNEPRPTTRMVQY